VTSGTLAGCLVGTFLVGLIGAHREWYWLLLPFIVFASVFAGSAVGFMASQAAFTVFAVVLFCILLPPGSDVGIQRLQDIAIGGAVSLVVGSLRRGASHWWLRSASPGKGTGRHRDSRVEPLSVRDIKPGAAAVSPKGMVSGAS
jgi:hypothetical protein